MVNVIIYLKKHHQAKALVEHLLRERLIASASIDENNIQYKLVNGTLQEEVNNVITAQSKSLLFQNIVKAVRLKTEEETPIISCPIISSNDTFDQLLRNNTMPI
jgi:uncharacterized protein involved in tolerance to divalent cations